MSNAIDALFYLATHPGSTTSDVAKAVFDPNGTDELRSADRKIRYYFNENLGHLIDADSDGKTTYRADPELVDAGLGRLEMQSFDGDEMSLGLGGVVMYPDDDGDPHIDIVGDIEVTEGNK